MTHGWPIWVLIVIVGAGAFALRFSFIGLYEKLPQPPWLERALRYAPVSVFAALVASSLMIENGALALSSTNPKLWAALVASAVAWRTRSILATIVVGLLALMALSQLM